jgi:mannose-6-phosphate isomerase-like protein (cupin superfamily)
MKKLLLLIILLASKFSLMAQQEGVKAFTLTDLLLKQQQGSRPWYRFLDEETITAGIYHLKVGQKDEQKPHTLDEFYYILSGKAKLKAGDDVIETTRGSIVYVKAHVMHYFFDVTEDLSVLVFFSKAASQSSDTTMAAYTLPQVEGSRKASENVWNPFHTCKTMVFGLYMLPLSLGGDKTLVHKIDEVNVITRGSGKFEVDGTTYDVKEGDVIYVKRGMGHYFHSLDTDLDILILFESKSTQTSEK